MKKITILTATFNRKETLKRLYESLKKQSQKSFVWMIVDDGSNDGTKKIIEKFLTEKKIEIQYIYQENKGKHAAVNTGIKKISTVLTFLVDSDDYLVSNAVETILHDWNEYNENICGISYLKGISELKIVGDKFPQDKVIGNFIDIRINKNIKGDKSEIWRTNLLRENPFPEYCGERFLGEAYVWMKLAKQYDMLFINKIIYICEYLENGLTKSGRLLRIKSPLGGIAHSKEALSRHFKLSIRIKNALLYVAYSFFAEKKVCEIIEEVDYKLLVSLCLPGGFFIYIYWKNKYL